MQLGIKVRICERFFQSPENKECGFLWDEVPETTTTTTTTTLPPPTRPKAAPSEEEVENTKVRNEKIHEQLVANEKQCA